MHMTNDINSPSTFIMILRILKLSHEDVGDYFCHAENALGSSTRPVSVRIRNTPITNIIECCKVQNVSSTCMDACGFYLDIESVLDRPECLKDFDKLMKCAADGSDHRGCCASKDVPRKCLNWCRGEPIITDSNAGCALQYTKTIVGCFQENTNRLPGPPRNLKLEKLSDDEILVRWEPPVKNPKTIEGYRVFWHEADVSSDNFTNVIQGSNTSKLDAKDTSIKIGGLRNNVIYELVIKAGNHYGNESKLNFRKYSITFFYY